MRTHGGQCATAATPRHGTAGERAAPGAPARLHDCVDRPSPVRFFTVCSSFFALDNSCLGPFSATSTMIYAVSSPVYGSFLTVSPASSAKTGPSSGGHKKAEQKAKGSDAKYQGE